MEEKKLTDKEIVKAYEHCYVNDGTCRSCCLSDDDKLCVSHEDVFDLIQRQKAEIERLEKDVHDMSFIIKIHKYCVGADHCKNSSAREFELQKQVDEWKYRSKLDLENEKKWGKLLKEQAVKESVKSTAKEIFEWLEKHCFFNGFAIVETYFRERYGVEVE